MAAARRVEAVMGRSIVGRVLRGVNTRTTRGDHGNGEIGDGTAPPRSTVEGNRGRRHG